MERDRAGLSRVLAGGFPRRAAGRELWVRAEPGLYPGGQSLAEENEFH